ncbi:MAG: ATP-binding protein [Bacteroidota bacterium]
MNAQTRTFPSTPDAVTAASSFVLDAAEPLGLSDEVREAMLLVVGEAVANAAGHGNGYDAAKQVTVVCSVADGEARLCVEDEGEGMSADRLDGAALPDDPLATSGRGLFIMTTVAERLWLEAGGRRLCLAWTHDAS